jgi:hypothetical protein
MLTNGQRWRQSLSRGFGRWRAKRRSPYGCPFWAEKDAYTVAYLQANGIIGPHESVPDVAV